MEAISKYKFKTSEEKLKDIKLLLHMMSGGSKKDAALDKDEDKK